jgi:hypothetical protein
MRTQRQLLQLLAACHSQQLDLSLLFLPMIHTLLHDLAVAAAASRHLLHHGIGVSFSWHYAHVQHISSKSARYEPLSVVVTNAQQ